MSSPNLVSIVLYIEEVKNIDPQIHVNTTSQIMKTLYCLPMYTYW